MDVAAANAYGVAEQAFDDWLADHARSGWARTFEATTSKLRNRSLGRAAAVLGHSSPCAAARRWVCDTIQVWAPLEVLFPTVACPDEPGVSGELAAHLPGILDREYAFLLDAAGHRDTAAAWLQADAQHLGLDLALAQALLTAVHDGADDGWIQGHVGMSLALAEYLHRQALGLHQLLADTVAMSYSTSVALRRRQLHAACRSTPCLVATTRRYA
ncbi:MAG: hypothetical protein AMXMBFR37_17370 [Steroidobacteraceae bacterium]